MPTVGRLVSQTGRFSDSVKIVTVSRITVRGYAEIVSEPRTVVRPSERCGIQSDSSRSNLDRPGPITLIRAMATDKTDSVTSRGTPAAFGVAFSRSVILSSAQSSVS